MFRDLPLFQTARSRHLAQMSADSNLEEQLEQFNLRDTAVQFKHAPLPTATSIRVLDVSNDLNADGQITCQVKVVHLDDDPEYCAMSYTWGDSGANPNDKLYPDIEERATDGEFFILCDGIPFKVTRNCYAMLETLRTAQTSLEAANESAESEPSLIKEMVAGEVWIDAICIDQTSLEERASQVTMMDRIYKQARSVMIWLGPADSTTRFAFEVIGQLTNVPNSDCNELQRWDIFHSNILKIFGLHVPIPELAWLAVRALYGRSWFYRAWTVQEYVLARESFVWSGGNVLPGSSVLRAAEVLSLTRWVHKVNDMSLEPHKNLSAEGRAKYKSLTDHITNREANLPRLPFSYPALYLGYLRDLQKIQTEKRVPVPLQVVLNTMAYTQSTEPNDKIYAYLGLIAQPGRPKVPVSYSTSPADLFVQATRVLIENTQSLSILSYVDPHHIGSQYIGCLPSWVPDYSHYTCIDRPLDWGSGDVEIPTAPAHGRVKYNASNGTKVFLQPKDSNDDTMGKLPLQGMFYSKIKTLIDFHPFQLHILEPIINVLTSLPKDRIWRTLLANEEVLENYVGWGTRGGIAQESDGNLFYQCLLTGVMASLETAAMSDLERRASEKKLMTPKEARLAYSIYKALTNSKSLSEARYDSIDASSGGKHSLPYDPSTEPTLIFHIPVEKDRWETHTLPGFESPTQCEIEFVPELPYIEPSVVTFFLRSIYERMKDRMLFTTDNCNIGAGYVTAKEGDEVWVLAGGRVPYVLRPQGSGEYELVGEAYVHDIMDGELVRQRRGDWSNLNLV